MRSDRVFVYVWGQVDAQAEAVAMKKGVWGVCGVVTRLELDQRWCSRLVVVDQ
jgi:hypothetical protein